MEEEEEQGKDNQRRFHLILRSLQTIGIDSEFCIVESLVTGIVDMWPETLRPRRRQFTTCLCLLLFAMGLPMITQVRGVPPSWIPAREEPTSSN